MPISLPLPPESKNIQTLAAWRVEEFTGLVTADVTLSQPVDAASGLCLVWKNTALELPSTITIAGSTLTLSAPLIAGDSVVVFYKCRGT